MSQLYCNPIGYYLLSDLSLGYKITNYVINTVIPIVYDVNHTWAYSEREHRA